MNKNFLTILLTTFLSLLLISSAVFASTNSIIKHESRIIFEQEEINDLNILFDNAKKGITDYYGISTAKAELVNAKTGKSEAVKAFTTTQLLKKVRLSDGQIKNSYATTNFSVLTKKQVDKIKDQTSKSFSVQEYRNMYDYTWDSTGGVKAYSTIYWDEFPSTTFPITGSIQMEYVQGGYYNYDTLHLGAKDNIVMMFQDGLSDVTGGGIFQNNSSNPWEPSSSTYTYYRPSGWVKVQDYQSSKVGSVNQITIYTKSNPSNTWLLNHQNLKYSGM